MSSLILGLDFSVVQVFLFQFPAVVMQQPLCAGGCLLVLPKDVRTGMSIIFACSRGCLAAPAVQKGHAGELQPRL